MSHNGKIYIFLPKEGASNAIYSPKIRTTWGPLLGVYSHLQEAFLLVEWECVEAHGADEGDPGGEDVEHVLALADPQPLQLGERREGAEVLQVQHLHVGQPQLKKTIHLALSCVWVSAEKS